MKLEDVQVIGNELALRFQNGEEVFITFEKLRRACPCAACKGEMDVMGNLHIGQQKPLSPQAFELTRVGHVGGYALQPVWKDGHSTGLYSYDYLRRVAQA